MLPGIAGLVVVFELLAYALLVLCLWHALQQKPLWRAYLIELVTGVLYGLVLETLTILQFHAYQYGHFLIALGPIPLAVGVGWGIILYSAMRFAESFALPAWAAPALVGLLGLNIDLAMDAVAIRLHMWQWLNLTLNEQWFGVPYVNFFAWFIVLCSFSALLWRGSPLTVKSGWQGPLAALGALLGSVVILALLDELVVQYNAHGGIAWLPVVVVLTGALVVVGSGVWVSRSSVRPSPVKASLSTLVPMVVPFYFHVFFLIMLFVANIAPRLPVLVGISLTMLWNVYMIQSTVWDWIPDVRDAAIPFVTGALELFLNHTITQSLSAWLLGLAGIAIIGALGTWHMDRRAGKEPENAKLLNFLRNHHRLLGLHYIGSAILMLLLALISYVGSIEAADGVQGVRGVLAVGIVLLVGGGLAFSVNISHRYWYKAIVYARTGHLPTRFGEDPLK